MLIKNYEKKFNPIKIIQFGEGNFLRAFADYMVDIANEQGILNGNIAVIKPIKYGSLEAFYEQDCNYTVILRGIEENKIKSTSRIVTSIEKIVDVYDEYAAFEELAELDSVKIIISNTTEAGIKFDSDDDFTQTPPSTYPAKLTKLFYQRFKFFSGDLKKGLIVLPVELIEDNGEKLLESVLRYIDLWDLGNEFKEWVQKCCNFCNTLVDRIVTGFPTQEIDGVNKNLGYEDKLLVTGECFGLWVIESKNIDEVKEAFPLDKAGLPVIFTDNIKPYKERKVKLLNGAHTSTVLAAYLMGFKTVGEFMKDATVGNYIKTIVLDEIAPTVHLAEKEVVTFAKSVFERFENPYINHSLLAISLNSVSKWTARILPSYHDYVKLYNKLPNYMTFSFAALLEFYTSDEMEDGGLVGYVNGEKYIVRDDEYSLQMFEKYSKSKSVEDFVAIISADEKLWGENLSKIDGFCEKVSYYLSLIRENGIEYVIENMGCDE